MEGFFKVSRQAFEHWLWKQKPFDEWHAWEYLFGMAAFADHDVYFQRAVRHLKRGQIATTYRQLARDWGWERKRVARFIGRLVDASMIQMATSCPAPGRENVKNNEKRPGKWATDAPGCLIVTVCNYDTYQGAKEKRPGDAPTNGPAAPRPRPGDAPAAPHDIRREEGKERQEGEESPLMRAFLTPIKGRRPSNDP